MCKNLNECKAKEIHPDAIEARAIILKGNRIYDLAAADSSDSGSDSDGDSDGDSDDEEDGDAGEYIE